MKKMLAAVLAIMMTFSAAALPDGFAGISLGTVTASAETWSSGKSLSSNTTINGDLQSNGDLKLNGYTLTVNGDLYMAEGALNIGTGNLVVNGNLYIGKQSVSAKSYIIMQNSSSSITVTKDLVWNVDSKMTNTVAPTQPYYTAGLITAGNINVQGNVTDCITSLTNYNSFSMGGTSVLNLNGTGVQTIKGSPNGILPKLNITGGRTVDMEGYYLSRTALTSDLDIVTQNGLKISEMSPNGHTVTIKGNVTQFSKNIDLKGGKLIIDGNFVAQSGVTKLSGGTLDISGNYYIAEKTSSGSFSNANAGLSMTNANDVVKVGKNFIVKNYAAGSMTNQSTISNGKMYVAGNIDISSGVMPFSSGNTVYMNGTSDQTLKFVNGSKKQKIYNLVLMQDFSKYNSDIADYATKLTYSGSTVALSSCTFTAISNQTYTGSAITPALTIKNGSTTLVSGTDYTATYSNNISVGTATVTVTGKGNYAGTLTKTFSITAKSLSSATVTLDQTSYTYDGTAKKPGVTVKDGSKVLTSGTDYTVSYSNNINAGTATVTVTGKGNYSGTKTATFTIVTNSVSISSCTVSTISSQTYTGNALTPALTIKYGSTTLVSGTDYTASYSNNTNVGTATVTITGKGKYTGTVTKTFTISAKSLSGTTVTLSQTNYVYDGTAKKPTVTVKDGSKVLTSGTDYTVAYTSNTNVGTATVTVTGKGNYSGSKTATFTIVSDAVSLNSCTVSTISSQTYTGSEITPSVTVKYGSTTLVNGTDYAVSYSNNINAGTATVTITGKGKYVGSLTKNFTISAKSLSSTTVTLDQTSYIYDGTAKKPAVTVKDGSMELAEGIDYSVAYSNNTNVGTATVTITGKGNYSGTKSSTFSIVSDAVSLSSCTVSAISSQTYTGSEITPAVTVTYGSSTLVEGTDYTLSYSNNTNVGTASVTITGNGKYTGTLKKTFSITAKAISSTTVILGQTNYVYDGTAKKPTVTVTDGSRTLTGGTDYTVSYSNNTSIGTATVTVTGRGNYSGTKTATFTIVSNAVSIENCTVSALSNQTYTGSAIKPTPTVTYGSTTLVSGTDYKISYIDNINVGTATVTITGLGKYVGSLTKTFSITANSLSDATVTLGQTSYYYDGTEKTPSVTVKDGSRILTKGTDFTVSYSNNINTGTATATITGKGNYSGSQTKTFTINARSLSVATLTLSQSSFAYDGTAITPAVTVKDGSKVLTSGTDYTVSYTNNTNVGTATVTVTGKGNYTGTLSTKFTIVSNTTSLNLCTFSSIYSQTYTGSEITPVLTVKYNNTTLVNGTDYELSYSDNINVGTATVTITGKGKYSGTKTKTFYISAKSISSTTVTLGQTNYTYDGTAKTPSVTVTDGSRTLKNGTDYTVAYSNNTNIGTATVTITGKGNYSGTKREYFTIVASAVSISSCTVSAISNQTYTGSAITPALTVKYGSTTLVKGTDYDASYSSNINAGTATVTITGKGKYAGSVTKNFTITAKSLSSATVTLGQTNYIYDGTAKKPSVTVKDGSKVLTEGTDYSVAYTNNTDIGTATVAIAGKGNYSGSKSATFMIVTDAVSLNSCTVSAISSQTYTGSEITPDVTVKYGSATLVSGADYTVSYSNNINAGTATVTITGSGKYTGSLKKTFTITAKSISGATVILGQTNYVYDGTAKKPSVTVTDGGRTLTSGTDYTVSYSNNTNIGTASVTVTGKGNYSGSVKETFTIVTNAVSLDKCTVSSISNQTYTGSAIKPAVTVKYGSSTLVSGTDYKVSYTNNINVGTATVTITGLGKYVGSLIRTFSITANALSDATVTLGQTSYYYDGYEKTPSVTIKDSGRILTNGTDYTVVYSNNINAGTATVSITGKGNYSGSISKTFNITARSLSVATVSLSQSSYVYDGTAKKPTVTVKDGTKVLTSGTDYTVAYTNNTSVGTATVTITGKGNYSGTKSTTFSIIKNTVSLNKCTVSAISSQTYTGSAITPALTIKDGTSTLLSGTDYTVSYSNNINAGTATVTITGMGKYEGTLKKTFTITAKSLSNATVTLGQTNYVYDGTAKKPSVTVTDGSKTLTSGTDYTVSYSNNTNVGTATVTITGKGNYSGTIKESFTIVTNAVSLDKCTVSAISNQTYTGTEIKPALTVKYGSTTLVSGTDYKVSYSSNINVGTATVTITGKGKYVGSLTKNFTITAKSVSGATMTLSQSSYVFDGTAKSPTVTVKDNGRILTKGTDYTVTYSNNTNVGTAAVTITGKGNYTGTKSMNFTIAAGAVDLSSCTVDTIANQTYTGSAITPALTVKDGSTTLVSGTDYTATYTSNITVGTAKVTIKGKGRYTGSVTKEFKITAKSVSGTTITLNPTSYTYDGNEKKPTVTVKDGSRTLTNGTDFTVAYSNNKAIGTATVTITGKGNYTGTKKATFTIAAKSVSNVKLAQTSFTYDGTAKTPDVMDGYTTLIKGTDYTVTWSNNVNAGTAKAVIVGKGSYSGTVTKEFTISAKSVSGLTATLAADNYVYDGKAKTPAVTVKDGSKTLTKGTDYTVTYSNNTNVGTASVTITGKGNYSGTKKLYFTISKKTAVALSTCTVTLAASSYTYDGTAKTPAVTVKNKSGATLKASTDYTVSYYNNVNAGTATVTITGKGDYSGNVSKTFTIKQKSISSVTIKLDPTTYEYDGRAKTPVPTVTDGSRALVKGRDFTLSYSNNTEIGKASITITGTGNYTGTKKGSFTITEPATDIKHCTIQAISSKVYTGSAIKPTLVVNNGMFALTEGKDYTVSYSNNVNAGTATATVKGIGKYKGTADTSFVITPKSMEGLSFTVSPAVCKYDGTAKTPAPNVTDGGRKLVNGKDFTVEYANNTEIGVASATVIGMGNYIGTLNASFTIAEKQPDLLDLSSSALTLTETEFSYDGTPKTPEVIVNYEGGRLTEGTDYTVSYSNNTLAGTGTVTVSGIGVYTGSVSAQFTIKSRDISGMDILIAADGIEYDGTVKTPAVTIMDDGVGLTENVDYTIEYSNNTRAGNAAVEIIGIGCYSGITKKNFTINASNISDAVMTLESYYYTADGSEKKPSALLKKDGRTLLEGIDYDIKYSNNKNAGTAYVSINGKGNYTGSLVQQFILGKDDAVSISDSAVSIDSTELIYDGTEKRPVVTVTKDGTELSEWQDFEVVYIGNIDAGTATAVIIGKNGFKDTVTSEFTILPASLENAEASPAAAMFEYDGTEKTPVINVRAGEQPLVEGRDFTVSYSDNTEVGTATAVVTGAGNYTGTVSAEFSVIPRQAENLTVALDKDAYTYNGSPVEPRVRVTDNGKKLTEGKDYTISYENNTQPGTGAVIVSGIGNYGGETRYSFKIKKGASSNFILGDVNGDGIINVTDISMVSAHVKSIKKLSGDSLLAADVNGDGVINVADISKISAHVKGLKKI